jgi:hypothetical protein
MAAALILNPSCRPGRGAGFVAKGRIIALGHLARKRTHQFIQQRLAARFRFTPIGIRSAVCHEIEMALAVWRTPRFVLAPSLVGAASKPFAGANLTATIALAS